LNCASFLLMVSRGFLKPRETMFFACAVNPGRSAKI
jgi:hypothetical protein